MMNLFPVLAVDFGAIVTLCILVLSILGWLVNVIKGEHGDQKPAPKRPGNAGGKDLRAEIQTFLDELTETRNSDVRRARKPKPVEADEDVIVLEEEPPRRPVRPAKPEKPRKKGRPVVAEPVAQAPSKPLAQQHLPTSRLGSGVQQHVATHMAGHVAEQAEQFIGNRVAQAVQQDLGLSTAAKGAVPNLSVAVLHPALKFITQPGALRDAVVLSEILQPPKALRNRKS